MQDIELFVKPGVLLTRCLHNNITSRTLRKGTFSANGQVWVLDKNQRAVWPREAYLTYEGVVVSKNKLCFQGKFNKYGVLFLFIMPIITNLRRSPMYHHRSRFIVYTLLLAAVFYALPAFAAEYVSVKKDGVNIRSGPDTKKEILWEVYKSFPLQVLKRKGKWLQTKDFEGDTGWIYAPLVSKAKTVIVKVKTANLRVGPGKSYELAATVKYGVIFTPIDRDGDWVKVKHSDGSSGWIYKTLIWP